MFLRIVIDILMLIVAIICPWWLTLPAGIMLIFYYQAYYEIILFGLLVDSLYSTPLSGYFHIQFLMTLMFITLFILAFPLKGSLRVYAGK